MVANIVSLAASGLRKFWNATLENPVMSLQDPRTWDEVMGGVMSDAGIRVTHHRSLEVASVFQAVGMISGDVGIMGPNIFKLDKNGDKEIDVDHPAEYLISEEPSPGIPAYEFWRRIMAHALLWGNGYAYIQRYARVGNPLAMFNLLPDRTAPHYTEDGTLYFVTEVGGELIPLYAEEAFHLKGVSIEMCRGCDLVDKARDSLGLALAAKKFGSKFFANGANTSGIIEIPVGMSAKAVDNVEAGFRKRVEGHNNWFKTMVLRDGAKFHATTIDAQKSQLVEVREEQVREVGRYFNLPPFKLGLQDSLAYNSAEMSQLVYLSGCLSHWTAAIQGEARIKLLTRQQRLAKTHFIAHNTSALLEIDTKTLNSVLEIQRRNEVINANEWRRRINMNRRTDPGGDTYLNPNTKSAVDDAEANPKSVGATGKPKQLTAPAGSDNSALLAPLRDVFVDAVDRSTRRVCLDARRMAKDHGKFSAWLDGGAFDHREVVGQILAPACNAVAVMMDGDAGQLCDTTCYLFFTDLRRHLSPLLEPPNKAADLQSNVDQALALFESGIAKLLTPKLLNPIKEDIYHGQEPASQPSQPSQSVESLAA